METKKSVDTILKMMSKITSVEVIFKITSVEVIFKITSAEVIFEVIFDYHTPHWKKCNLETSKQNILKIFENIKLMKIKKKRKIDLEV